MKYIFLLAIIFISACISPPVPTEQGLTLKMDANPKEVFGEGITTISIDVENQDVKTLRDVNADIFEIGSFNYADNNACSKNFGNLDVKDFKTFACNLKAKKVERDIDNTIWARARYKSSLAAVQTFDIISQAESELRKRTGKPDGQKSFSFKDNNLELTMELSNSPMVDKAGREFVSFKIKNIGNGFIEKLRIGPNQIKGRNVALDCKESEIFIIGNEFPRYSCSINLNGDVVSFITAEISINIDYDYEIRNSVDVRIIK